MLKASLSLLAAMLLPLIQSGTASPDSALKAVAALAGEPHLVSAAGLTKDGVPLRTIENPTPFESTGKRRVVLVARVDAGPAAARAVLDIIRWFKTAAPAAVRRRWDASALPLADVTNPHVVRWIVFQAPDLVVDIGEDESNTLSEALNADGAKLGTIRVVTAPVKNSDTVIRRELTDAHAADSPVHGAISGRVSRDPIALARVLANRYPQTPAISYIAALSWINTLRLADLDRNETLRVKVRDQVQPWLAGKPLFGDQILLTSIAGTMIFADLASGGDAAARPLAAKGADLAAAQKDNGIAQYGQGWTDDMFMASAILARTGRTEGRQADLDRAAALVVDYAGRLQRLDGLFNHATDGPAAWGRGNGFAALGITNVLSALPEQHPARARLLQIYRAHMKALVAMQAPDGMWRQVIDVEGAYREETATAMILTAIGRGIRQGWIDAGYATAVERGWGALLAHVAEDGALVDVCAGTGSGPTLQYYLDRPAITGFDDRGGAMALMAAIENYATFQPSPRREFINLADRSMSSPGSSTSSIDSVPSGRVMTTR